MDEPITGLLSAVQKEIAALSKDRPEPIGKNIFSITGIKNKELIHSRFIGYLLNPRGKHGKGPLFLDKFLDVCIGKKSNLNSGKAAVKLEKSLGKKNNKKRTGGRVDIEIRDDQSVIAIENKIFAGDQPFQMEGYYNVYHKEKKLKKDKILMIYLTLDGREAGSNTLGDIPDSKTVCMALSYEKVSDWLAKCLEKCDDDEQLRFIIQEYKKVIESLTYTYKEKREVVKILMENKKSVEAAFSISNSINDMKAAIIKEHLKKILEKAYPNNELECTFYHPDKLLKEGYGFAFFHKEWEALGITIAFQFFNENLKDLKGGIRLYDWHKSDIQVLEYFKNEHGFRDFVSSHRYLLLEDFHSPNEPNYKNWDQAVFLELMDDAIETTGLYKLLKEKIDKYYHIIEEAHNWKAQ
jgi:predicted hydrocarbon binding protein